MLERNTNNTVVQSTHAFAGFGTSFNNNKENNAYEDNQAGNAR